MININEWNVSADVAQKYREKTAELDKLRCEVCDLIEGGFEAKAEIAIEKHRKLLNDAEFKKLVSFWYMKMKILWKLFAEKCTIYNWFEN